jgi:hypothetical protein
MATSTLLQKLDGGSDFGVTTSARRQVEVFIAAETVVEKDAVSLDLSQTEDGDKALKIVKADTGTATDKAFVGVVLKSAEPDGSLTAGSRIFVVTAGPVEANVAGATVAGSLLQIGSTAGQLDVRTVAVDEGGAATFNLFPIAAIAAEADTANVATVMVYKQFV